MKEVYHIHQRLEGEQKWSNGEVVTEDSTKFNVWDETYKRAKDIAGQTNVAEVEIRQVVHHFAKVTIIQEESLNKEPHIRAVK